MTDRWHPASTYSASVRDQPSVEADNQGAPASSASTQSRSITISASPKMSRQHRSSDIPVHPDLLHNRLSSDLTVVSPDLLLVIPSAQTAESSRKRRASANHEAQQTDLTKSTKQQRPSLSENRCDRPSDGLSSTLASQGDSKNEGQNKQDVQPSKPKPTRGSRACTVCRRLKMRCTDAENGPPCRRCRLGKHQCIFEESQRGKKGTKRTDLLAKNLQTVEEKLDAVMSKMQNHVNSVDAVVGTPVSPLEYSTQTHKGSQTLHTPAMVGSRSPFLFTAICAVASRYYEKRNELHLNCLQAAKRIAFDVMVKGYKSVEVVQAFVLLSHWNQPAERFEEDRTWAFSGIAIRMAIDLNLHRKTTLQLPLAKRCTNLIAHSVESYQSDEASSSQQADMYEREILNRERTWLYCFILDRSLSAQMGKPYSIREDFIIRSSKDWHKQRCSVPEDAGITAMVDLHRIHSRILDTLYSDTCSNSGLNANLDYSLLMKTFSQLFTMSFMLQHTLENPDKKIELPQVYVTCYDAASRVITIARDQLGPLGVLRYASDNQFVYIAYAAVFLLKLIRPQFQFFCDRLVVRNLVHDCTVLLDQVSVDETHTPALYASFLRLLLRSKNESSSDFNVVSHKEELESHAVKAVHSGGTESQFVEQSNEKKREELYVLNKDSTGDRQAEENFSRESIEFLEPLVDSKTSLPAETATAQMHSPGGVERSLPENLMDLDQRMNQGTNFQELQQQHPANDCFVDSLLKDGGFWDSMLMPGYSGPLDALSGGAGLVSHFGNNIFEQSNCFSFNTPSGSGRASPNQYNFLNQSTK
ncbi:fungal-specific transcription factor domain-containing protein [Phakopsora pachyrhizi]|nr:fungal-specific transcription factor domain-containing protein [Phakopsora pachyrhizi]